MHAIAKTALRVVAPVVALLLASVLPACSGCGRERGAAPQPSAAEEVETILSQPQRLDDQTLDEFSEKIQSNVDVSEADLAAMMIQLEAVSNQVSMEAERLQQVQDPADTFESLTAIRESQYWKDYLKVYECMSQAQLPDAIAGRMALLRHTNQRVQTVLTEIETRDLKGQNILDI